jgi:hydrogenase nickel incorporation protein HypA/HybF
MHELGLAQGVLELVRQYVPVDAASLVRQVRIRVGEMSGVVPESLAFCFSAVIAGTPYDGASLAIDRVSPTGQCASCGLSFPFQAPACACPSCGGSRISLIAGRELQVVDVELDEAEVPAS